MYAPAPPLSRAGTAHVWVCCPRSDVGGAGADSRAASPLVGEIRCGVENEGAVVHGIRDRSGRTAAHLPSFGGSTFVATSRATRKPRPLSR